MPHVVGTLHNSSKILVFFHAMKENNADPYDRIGLFRKMHADNPDWAFVFPAAPHRVRCEGDAVEMWWLLPCQNIGRRAAIVLPHYHETTQLARDLINTLLQLPQQPQVYVSGFSQGGAVALAAVYAATCDIAPPHLVRNVTDVVVFSTYFVSDFFCTDSATPLLWVHHPEDFIVK